MRVTIPFLKRVIEEAKKEGKDTKDLEEELANMEKNGEPEYEPGLNYKEYVDDDGNRISIISTGPIIEDDFDSVELVPIDMEDKDGVDNN